MKKLTHFIFIFFWVSLLSSNLYAENYENTKELKDSINNEIKLRRLRKDKEDLISRIKIEDSKRNQQVSGVAEETLEIINDRQDSICLVLRSRLVDINIEIKELTPSAAYPGLLRQYNNIINANSRNNNKMTN